MLDRLISIATYCTMGIFGLIWLVFSFLTKRRISSFLSFNIYQSMFIMAFLAIFSLIYDIAKNILSIIPFVGKIIAGIDIFLNGTPMYFSFTITGFILVIFLSYLSILCLLGKRPYVPYVSQIVASNFGG